MLVFDSEIFDLAHGWLGMFVVLLSGDSPISDTYKFYPPNGANFSCGVGPLRRGNPCCRSGSHVLPRGENPINGVSKPKLREGNPCSRAQTLSWRNLRVTWMYVGEPLLLPPSGRNPIPIKKQGSAVIVDAHTSMQCNILKESVRCINNKG